MADTAKTFIWGTGRRKSSVARIRMAPGSGKIEVNGKPFETFFPRIDHQHSVTSPLKDTKRQSNYDIWIKVEGGGITGQAGAARLAIARAILSTQPEDEELRKSLKDGEHLTRDPRMKERKKYGQRGARARFQFSKR